MNLRNRGTQRFTLSNASPLKSALMLTAAAGLAAATGQAVAGSGESRGDITLAYVEWSDAIASTNVMQAVLEEAGFQVETTSLSAAAMWQAVASGDADAMVTAWLPTTHESYFERLNDQVVDMGPNLDGTRLGLTVPDYVEAESIADLAEQGDAFDGRIVGIDPGAGIMSKTEEVMDAYGLDDMTLVSGSGATMTAALGSAIDNEEPIVVTGWTPHWMFSRWDLRYLDDPQNVFGGTEQIHTIARQGLDEDMPMAACILDNFEWTPDELSEVMLLNQDESQDPAEDAQQWVENNQDMVGEWMQGCMQQS